MKFKEKIKEIAKENKKTFIYLIIIYIIALIPLIRANFNYYDDVGRNLEGNIIGWLDFSRYGSIFLSFFLFFFIVGLH